MNTAGEKLEVWLNDNADNGDEYNRDFDEQLIEAAREAGFECEYENVFSTGAGWLARVVIIDREDEISAVVCVEYLDGLCDPMVKSRAWINYSDESTVEQARINSGRLF